MNERIFTKLFAICKCLICSCELEESFIASRSMVWDIVKQGLIIHSKNQELLTPSFARA